MEVIPSAGTQWKYTQFQNFFLPGWMSHTNSRIEKSSNFTDNFFHLKKYNLFILYSIDYSTLLDKFPTTKNDRYGMRLTYFSFSVYPFVFTLLFNNI